MTKPQNSNIKLPASWQGLIRDVEKSETSRRFGFEVNSFELIGSGGFGNVYKIETPKDGTLVAKVLTGGGLGFLRDYVNPEPGQSVVEGLANIIPKKVRDCEMASMMGYRLDISKGSVIVAQYIEGSLLSDFAYSMSVRSKGVTIDTVSLVLDVSGMFADSVDTMHQEGILHRDIKLKNAILSYDEGSGNNSVVLIDNDFATDAEDPHVNDFVFGTPGYVSPEATKGESCEEGDVYSLGAAITELVSGAQLREYPANISDEDLIREIYKPVNVDIQSGFSRNQVPISEQVLRLEEVLQATQDIDKGNRPTAEEVADASYNAWHCYV